MPQSIKAIIDEFRKSSILVKGETFEEQVRYGVMMNLVQLSNKCTVHQLKAEAEGHLAAKQRSLGRTEDLYQDYLEHSKSRYFKAERDIKEHLDAMRALFYVPGTPGYHSGYYRFYGSEEKSQVSRSSGRPDSFIHADKLSTVEEAYQFRKVYLPLYIKILQDILQDA
jgi:hypothetical protein